MEESDHSTLISFHSESIEFEIKHPQKITKWIEDTTYAEQKDLGTISIIFCSDDYLLDINKSYLDHDYYTDIISFPYSKNPIGGDLFISIDRIRENADNYKVTFDQELYRVIIHGVLHLLGYKDKTSDEQDTMTQKENYYLSLLEI